ncbi:MAG: hypothetical protein ACK5G7_05445 [Erysipelotrichaceae bacterium]
MEENKKINKEEISTEIVNETAAAGNEKKQKITKKIKKEQKNKKDKQVKKNKSYKPLTLTYITLNIVFISIIAFFAFQTIYSNNYPERSIIETMEFTIGEQIQVLKPGSLNEEYSGNFSVDITNDTTEEKEYYIVLNVDADESLDDILTIQHQEGNIYAAVLPNSSFKKITLKPNESKTLNFRVYIDIAQTLDSNAYNGLVVTISLVDDYVTYYSIEE